MKPVSHARPPNPQQRRGAIVVLAALFMVFMVGMMAFAVDLGVITLARTQLQCAADAAALAGADTLADGPSAAQDAAQDCAQANIVGGRAIVVVPAEDIELGTWDEKTCTFSVLTGSALANANAVRVTCRVLQSRGDALPLSFACIFSQSATDVGAVAIATRSSVNCGPFVGLNYVAISGGSYTDSYDSDNGPYSRGSAGSRGHVCSNGAITLSGDATVHGDAHPGQGCSVSTSGGASVTGSKTPLTAPLTEAAVNLGRAVSANNNASIPLSRFGKKPLDGSRDFSLSGGDSVVLPPGTYFFATATLSGGSTMIVTGPTTIYVAGNINFSGGSVANTTQIPANLKLYGIGSKVVLSGSTQTYAVIYAPNADITRSGGSSDFFGMMVGKSLTLSGGGGLHYDESLGSTLTSQGNAHLVQ